jgi:hypothetical protein
VAFLRKDATIGPHPYVNTFSFFILVTPVCQHLVPGRMLNFQKKGCSIFPRTQTAKRAGVLLWVGLACCLQRFRCPWECHSVGCLNRVFFIFFLFFFSSWLHGVRARLKSFVDSITKERQKTYIESLRKRSW